RLHAYIHSPGSNVSAHRPGADDVDFTRLKAVLGRLVLEHLRKLEHAAQVSGGFARHKRRECLGLGDAHADGVVAELLEEIDEAEWRRVMLLAHLLRRLG